MIYKISPPPSLPKRGKEMESFAKRGREKADMTHSIWKRPLKFLSGILYPLVIAALTNGQETKWQVTR
ncbi:MAG: hypothetical protein KGZ49_05500 [Syntrophaceae bacterium]|nr:hypothetical protein [Syntrophaceae bacterium]